MYLIEPTGRVRWTDLPERMLMDGVKEHGVDLARLDWREDTERRITNELLQIAMRHGIACSIGIAIPVTQISVVEHPETLRKAHAAVVKSRRNLGEAEDLMEALVPGWKADTERLNAEGDAATERSLAEFQSEADGVMAAPINEELVRHWRSLGGSVGFGPE